MKRPYHILFALILALVSCTQELEIREETPADCIMLNVCNSPMTKAAVPEGTKYERSLKRLDCFFYVKGETGSPCVYHQKVDMDKVGDAVIPLGIPLYVDETTINTIFPGQNTFCDVFLIANLPSGTFESGGNGTEVPALEKITLNLDGTHDAIDKPFVMWGLGEAEKGDDNNASGEIKLYRAAAKITISVNIPAQIKTTVTTVNPDNTTTITEKTMTPVFTDTDGKSTLKTAFHYGVKKTYLHADYVGDDGQSLLTDDDYFATGEKGYSRVSTTPATGTTPEKYLYKCEVPFYTYARAWEKGASDAAYLTLELPWKDESSDSYDTYYYQILVNGHKRNFLPNTWYDLTVNVGLLGSTVESKPTLLEDMTYYVLDWTTEPESDSDTGDRYEDVVIDNYTYLIVPEKRIELNNTSTGVIRYDASHKIGIKMNEDLKPVEILENDQTEFGAYYVYCKGDPTPTELPINPIDNFIIDDSKGTLTYNYEIPEDVYSPVYIYVTVWLELDGIEGMNTDEREFSENITIVQYPAIYIIPSESTEYSVFVNAHNRETDDVTCENGSITYNLGAVGGTSNRGDHMYIISVSSFKANDFFQWRLNQNEDYVEKSYIIGDPRSRTPLNSDDYNMTAQWAIDQGGTGRRLEHYYPTATDGESYRIIAPQFRMASFFGGQSANCTHDGAMLRCASYQEDGYPAGRWRIPTTAEVQFVIALQNAQVITPIFYDGNYYYSATQQVDSYGNVRAISDDNNTRSSVRCVYDEWYWGSEREAQPNDSFAGGYEFTWGDEKIW